MIKPLALSIEHLRGWPRALTAFVAGAVSALAFAPFDLFPILWITLPVFVWLLDGVAADEGARRPQRLRAALGVGWTFGFGFFLAGLWWIGAAFLVDAGIFALLMPIAVLLLPAGLALFWAAGAAAAVAVWGKGPSRILVLAVAMTVAEYLRGHLLTGFPWNAFGYALTPTPVMMQSAALVGIWGLTLVAFVVFAAPATFADPPGERRLMMPLVGAVLMMAHVGFGAARLAGAGEAASGSLTIRIVQPAIPQDERWLATAADAIMDQYVALSRTMPDSPSTPPFSLLIWPESAFPFFLTERESALAAIADLLPPGGTLVTGAARRGVAAGGGATAYNSVFVIDDRGTVIGTYDKVHLVPFGEYLPWRGLFDALGIRQLVQVAGGFSAGRERRLLSARGVPPFSPLVCYEIIFPGEAAPAGPRPAWLLNVTNDAWYGDTPGPYQHLAQARIRAVEQGLPLVRASNSGISAVIDAYGRVIRSLPLDEAGVIDATLPEMRASDIFYATFGDAVLGVLLIGAVAAAYFVKFT